MIRKLLQSTLFFIFFSFSQTLSAQCWTNVWPGSNFCLAQKPDGSIWAWGKNTSGQYGNGTTSIKRSPIKVDSSNQWKRISTSYGHVLAIKQDGSLWGWGENGSGELGLGDFTDRLKAVRIGTRNDWVKVFAGFEKSFALTSDSILWCWGNNAWGALGDGSVVNRNIPAKLDSTLLFDTVAAGSFHTMALTRSHKMYVWGRNDYSQNGDPSLVNQFTVNRPRKIGTDSTWAMVATGGKHSVALKSDGTIWTWGKNEEGELGDSSLVVKRESPGRLGALNSWKSISAQASSYTLAQKADGTLWGWGRNYAGCMGFGADIIKHRPFQIGSATDWENVKVGVSTSFFLNNSGNLFSCGTNSTGALGQGLLDSYSAVIGQVGCLTTSSQDLLEDENGLSVYPNPGTGEFHISGCRFPATVRVVDMMGRLKSETFVQTEEEAVLFVQEPGMYVVQVQSKGQNRIKTLIVK
jgi:alpha-tubulin suppressor-like RCC1 family protein